MTRPSNGSVAKRTKASASRQRKPKTAQSAVTRVSPEAIERFADMISRLLCAVGRPDHGEALTEADRASRDQRGADYIAAIAEQRPGVEGHGYPGGYPDWDQSFRLWWTGRLGKTEEWWTDIFDDRSIILPDWMALPLVRQVLNDPELRSQLAEQADKPDEPDSDKL